MQPKEERKPEPAAGEKSDVTPDQPNIFEAVRCLFFRMRIKGFSYILLAMVWGSCKAGCKAGLPGTCLAAVHKKRGILVAVLRS
jgi:hypothetical protein